MIPLIAEENYRMQMMDEVEPVLEAMREMVDMPLQDGGTLHAEAYVKPDAQRALVILHGFTESCEKFHEMIWYFLQAGFSVFAPDHRGHGLSVRVVEDPSITHVDRFEDYVHDLEQFVQQVVRPRAQGLELCLYAHSMGGAIGAMTLMEHPDWFARAVLTAPMIAPSSAPFPAWAGRLMASSQCIAGRGRKMAFVGKPYSLQDEVYERSFTTSVARYTYYKEKRSKNRHLQNNGPSYGWVREAMGVTRTLLDPRNAARIKTPLLLCQATQDTVVRMPEQAEFVRLVPGARLHAFDARHEIYMSDDAVMREYVDAVVGFLSAQGEAPSPQSAGGIDEGAAGAPDTSGV